MGKRKIVDRGDVIVIPTLDGREVYAQVCWASSYYKDVIQIAFINASSEANLTESFTYIEPTIFTGSRVVREARWRKLFTHHQTYEPFPPVFYSAGIVHKGDEYLREASEDDRNSLLNLSVLGTSLVEKQAVQVANQMYGSVGS